MILLIHTRPEWARPPSTQPSNDELPSLKPTTRKPLESPIEIKPSTTKATKKPPKKPTKKKTTTRMPTSTTTTETSETYMPEIPEHESKPETFEHEDTPSCRSPPLCSDPDIDHEIIHRDPCDCKKFYRCNHNEAQEFSCMDKLVFNPTVQTCDWPDNVLECKKYYLKHGADYNQEGYKNQASNENEVEK